MVLCNRPDSCRRYYTRPSNRERLDTLADGFRRMASQSENLDEYTQQLKNETLTVSHLDSFVNETATDGGAPSPSQQSRSYVPENGDIVISGGLPSVGQVDPRLGEAGEFVLGDHELEPSFLPQKRKH